jgi:hypothetical protein
MKFKNLLSLSVMLSCGLVTQAQQVFQEPFDAEQTKAASDVAFYEFINQEEGDDWKISDGGFKGKALFLNNDAGTPNDNATWRRAVKFRNLPLQEGKSYRLTYYLKGSVSSAKARVSLMQGVENADIPVGSQADITNIGSEFTKYSHVYYFKSKAEQDAEYDKQCASKEAYNAANKDKYFASFNIYNPGEFFLDEVTLEEAVIAGASYNGDVICVDLGHPTNAASLASQKASGNYLLDNSTATVTVNGKAVDILTVELRKDGKLYIFLADAVNSGEVKVTFKNPDGLIKCNDGFELTEFTETAELNSEFNKDGEIYSDIYTEPALESVTPLDGSFALESKDLKTITLTFDKKVFAKGESVPKATLSTGAELTLKTTEETSNTLTFEYNGPELAKGTYSIKVENIVSDQSTPANDIVLTYEIGKINLAKTEYTEIVDKTVADCENVVPLGWKLYNGAEDIRENGTEYSSGPRGFNFTGSTVPAAMYFRSGLGNSEIGSAEITEPVTIPAGEVEFRAYYAAWKNPGFKLKITLTDEAGNEVIAKEVEALANANGNRTLKFDEYIYRFKSNGGKYNYKIETVDAGVDHEALCGGFKVFTYKESAGDKVESEVILNETFASCGGNMPAEGSGWIVYENNNPLAAGSGRSGTSGILNLGTGGMAAAFFARECGANENGNMRITYGEQEGGPKLELKQGTYEISYKTATWNDEGGNANGTSKVFLQIIDAATGEPVLTKEHVNSTAANYKNGANANPNVEADKVSFSFTTDGGTYILKAWGTQNTVWGDVKIEKPGSKAAKYYQNLAEAVELAKQEAALAAEEKYNGKTKDALNGAIAKYDVADPKMHTDKEFDAAVKELEALVKQSKGRRANIDKYPTSLESLQKAIDEAKETKYANIPEVADAEKYYNENKDVDYVKLDDAALAKAVEVLDNKANLTSNMVKTCLPLVTKQITDLAAAIVALDEASANDETVLAAGNVTTDDQKLVAKLKYIYTSKLYKKIATENPFKTKDADTGDEVDVTIPASFLIQNANFYSTGTVNNGDVAAKETDFPGWTIEKTTGNISAVWGTAQWCGEPASATKPVVDAAVKSPWGTSEYDAKQLIEDIPVGKYNVSIIVGEDGGGETRAESYAYLGEGDAQIKNVYEGEEPDAEGKVSYSRDTQRAREFNDIVTKADGNGGNFGSILLGAHVSVNGGFGRIDNATLTITGKADNFDYAKAAAAIDQLLATSIESVEAAPAGEPTSVKYYTVDGKQTLNPQGITIKVESWANGYMKVSKVVK